MATGERITVTYAKTPSGPLKLDLYAYVPKLNLTDPSPTFANDLRLPFFLYLHAGHFFTGSRRDLPAWLPSLAKSMNMPLVCADYRLAPHVGPSDAYKDIEACWAFIREELNWVVAAAGNGAEVQTGTKMLEEDFEELQRRGGLDPRRCVLVGLGAGGYLAARGAAQLSPPPLAVVLGYPLLDLTSSASTSSTSSRSPSSMTSPPSLPRHIQDLLSETGDHTKAKVMVPDTPLLLDRAPYALNVRSRSGMDVKERWQGRDESERRRGVVEALLSQDALATALQQASPDVESTSAFLQAGVNRPYPPTIVYHGLDDTRVPCSSSEDFIRAIRSNEPVAAAVDSLSQPSVPRGRRSSASARVNASDSTSSSAAAAEDDEASTSQLAFRCAVEPAPNHTSRYVYLPIRGPGAGHGFDALLPRQLASSSSASRVDQAAVIGSRYLGGMVIVENFIRHWLNEGSSAAAASTSLDSFSSDAASTEVLPKLSPSRASERAKAAKGGSRL